MLGKTLIALEQMKNWYPKGPGIGESIGTGEFSAIDVGKGLNVEVHRGVYRHEREHSGP